MPSDDEFDAIPDEFEGFNFDAIPDLATQSTINDHQRTPSPTLIPRPDSPNSSSNYSCDDDFDESVLVELDAIEDQLGQDRREPAATTSSSVEALSLAQSTASSRLVGNNSSTSDATYEQSHSLRLSRFFEPPSESHSDPLSIGERLNPSSPKTPTRQKTVAADIPPRTSRKRGHSASSPVQSSIKTDKSKVEPKDGVRQILERFEHEMTCPICCDIFVAAHLGNPCGHSFCGECGWEWISKNKRSPTCAVCRAKLFVAAPMIPNFALDSTVTRHLEALAASGEKEWQPNGTKIIEWNTKKEKWKKDSANRAAEATKKSKPRSRGQRADTNFVDLVDDDMGLWLVPDDDEADESYDEAVQLIPPPARLRPRLRRSHVR